MAHSTPPVAAPVRSWLKWLGRTKFAVLTALLVLLAASLAYVWFTRDAMDDLPFLRRSTSTQLRAGGAKVLVDLGPWQTAATLASMAVTSEEQAFAVSAERLGDHEVDQAFASALRQASMQVAHRVLTGDALALSQRATQLEELVREDQAAVDRLSPAGGVGAKTAPGNAADDSDNSDDLDVAKAQLGLDNDQLDDAQQDLARASGDDRAQIQSELTQHEAEMAKHDSEMHGAAQVAVASVANYSTLSDQLGAWKRQQQRGALLEQAKDQAERDAAALTAQHNTLEASADTAPGQVGAAEESRSEKLANLRERSAERQLLSIYDDRIQTEHQLAAVYADWVVQVRTQHRILLHLIVESVALIALILVCVILVDMLVVRWMTRPGVEWRRTQTMRTMLQLGIQILGAALVLIVVYGLPRQMPTILGLVTAGLTVALQDFIIAFFGWFVLMGKNGIRIGDWVEINGVGGEVTEIGLFRTTMLETGNWTDKGHPTGRRVTFINGFAIRGQFFNFSTAGQWMWDQISVSVPAGDDPYAMVKSIHETVRAETEKDARVAEQEWQRGTRHDGLSQFTAEATVDLRPNASGVDVLVRYVTRASNRAEMRNRLFQRVIEVLRPAPVVAVSEPAKV